MLKVEVGKKYINENGNIYEIFYHDNKNNIFYGRSIDSINSVYSYGEDGAGLAYACSLIKEYKEPIKKSITGWLNYNDNESFACYIVDILTGKDASVYFYRTKEEAQADLNSAYPKTMKFKLDFEQIED